MANSTTDIIMAPFLRLALHYEEEATKERQFQLKRNTQNGKEPDLQILISQENERVYTLLARQIRDCARQIIREGY